MGQIVQADGEPNVGGPRERMIRGVRAVASLCGLGVARVAGRLRIAPHRVLLSVLGVALAIGLMVSVTGISLGLASQSVVESEGVNYWIVPEGSATESVVVSAGGVELGHVHRVARQLNQDDRVEFATPVLITLLPVNDAQTGARTYVLAVGIIPTAEMEIFGLPAGALTPGDPHYANGSYDGPMTNELVLNEAAATVTNATEGMNLTMAGKTDRALRVVNVSEGDGPAVSGSVPVALLHLSELQTFSGAATGDQADQILVSTTDPSVKPLLTGRYPRTTVVTRSGLSAQQVSTSSLPLAVAIAALVSAVVVGVLFITTVMGLEVNANRQQVGVLAAIGFSWQSRSLIVATETVSLALVGGVLGVGVGALGIVGINAFGRALLGLQATAVFDPLLVAYAVMIAVVIGVVGAVYPVLVSVRTSELEVLRP